MEARNLCPSTTATVYACHSIVHAFAENIYELAHLRKEWSVAYADKLKNESQEIIDILSANLHFQSTMDKLKIWRELMISSLTSIGIIRASVKNDFKKDKSFQKEFYQQLGYNDFFSEAKNGDHYSMFKFIRTFANNLTPEIREKILANGLDPHVVDRVIYNSKQLDAFKECFELMENPEEQKTGIELRINNLYSEVRDISRIATAYYYFEPQRRESFNFFKTLRNLK